MKVLIVDDDSSVRSILRRIIENQGCEVVAEAVNGLEGIKASEKLRPDLILLDISMPVMGGFGVARHLHKYFPELAFIFVSQHRDQCYLDEARACGARGFILKSGAATELPLALQACEAGQLYEPELVNKGTR
ncbi:MAG: response regulator transcription factor [Bryobacteraceae bacterium]